MHIENYILWVCLLTAVIHFVGIVSLSVRIVGTQTRKIASSTSIFNFVGLLAQFSAAIQAPLLTKSIEKNIILGSPPDDLVFRVIVFSATMGAVLGAFGIPTMHRFMKKAVDALYLHNSIFMVIVKSFKLSTLQHLKHSLKLPVLLNFVRLKDYKDMPLGILLLNVAVYSFITVSVLSCLYAGYLNPNLRTTALSMNGFSIGLGVLGLSLFVEPYTATLTDKVIAGKVQHTYFRKYLTYVIAARILGTLLGQFLLIPLAHVIIRLAEWL
jgi:hypothetical protein